MQIETNKFNDIVKSMVGNLDAQHPHVQTVTGGGKPLPFHIGCATASSALAAALEEHGITITDEAPEHFDAMTAGLDDDLKVEGTKIFRITHHYDIGDQDVHVEHPTGDVDGRRVALYLWFKACDWFGSSVLISNLGIASAMVAYYGFRHCATHPFSTTVDLYADAEGFRGYDELMSDASLHREGLRDAMAPHVEGCAGAASKV